MTTRILAMNMIDDGGEANVAPSAPLFASSWLALYYLLKQELENRRDGGGPPEDDSGAPPQSPRPN